MTAPHSTAAGSNSAFRRLVTGFGWYSLGDGLLQGISTLIEPALTRVLTPEEFGYWGTSSVVLLVLLPVLSLAIWQGVSRAWLRVEDDAARREVAWTGIRLQHKIAAAMVGVVTIAAALFGFAGWNALPFYPWMLLVIATAWLQSATAVPRTLLVMEERPALGVSMSAISTFGFLGSALLLYTLVSDSVISLFVARLIGAALALLAVVRVQDAWRSETKSEPAVQRKMITESVPYVWHLVSHAILRLGDRWIIGALLGMASVGIYSAAWFFADAVGLVTGAMNRALAPQYAKLRVTEAGRVYLRRALSGFTAISQASVLGATLLAPQFVAAFYGEKFHDAIELVPFVALSGLPLSLYLVHVNRVFVADRHSKTPRWTIFSALVKIALSWLAISKFGLLGAAATSVISYFVLFAGIRWEARGVDTDIFDGAMFSRTAVGSVLCFVAAAVAANLSLVSAFLAVVVGLAAIGGVWWSEIRTRRNVAKVEETPGSAS